MKLISIAAPLFGALVLLSGCKAGDRQSAPDGNAAEAAIAPILTTPDAVDVHSFAKPLEARVTHVALDLNVDFDASASAERRRSTSSARRTPSRSSSTTTASKSQSVTDAAKAIRCSAGRREGREPRRAAGDRAEARHAGEIVIRYKSARPRPARCCG